MKVIDAVLSLFFILIAIGVPLFAAQLVVPQEYYPKSLVDLHSWFTNYFGHYLFVEKPNFYKGLAWLELFVTCPLSLINLFALLSAKSWFKTTCLIYGSVFTTSMVTVLSELIGSGKASKKLLMFNYPFLGLAVLALLRGLLPVSSCKTTVLGKRPMVARKKRV